MNTFKLFHNISFWNMIGYARAVKYETITEWHNKVWPKVHEGYSDSHIHNTDDTVICSGYLQTKH
jgi:hypothetical protein